jgi:hypothetical protein
MSKLPEMTTYNNQTMGLTLAVPVGWTGKVLGPQAFRIFGPPEAKHNNYRATLSVEKLDLTEDSDDKEAVYGEKAMADLIIQARDDLKSEMQNFELLREERISRVDGLPAYAHWFGWRDPESGMSYAQIQALVLTAEGSLYIFNAAGLRSLESYHTPIFEHIIRSARILS